MILAVFEKWSLVPVFRLQTRESSGWVKRTIYGIGDRFKASHIYFGATWDLIIHKDYNWVFLATSRCTRVKINTLVNRRGIDQLVVRIFLVGRIRFHAEGGSAERARIFYAGRRPGVRYYQQLKFINDYLAHPLCIGCPHGSRTEGERSEMSRPQIHVEPWSMEGWPSGRSSQSWRGFN